MLYVGLPKLFKWLSVCFRLKSRWTRLSISKSFLGVPWTTALLWYLGLLCYLVYKPCKPTLFGSLISLKLCLLLFLAFFNVELLVFSITYFGHLVYTECPEMLLRSCSKEVFDEWIQLWFAMWIQKSLVLKYPWLQYMDHLTVLSGATLASPCPDAATLPWGAAGYMSLLFP